MVSSSNEKTVEAQAELIDDANAAKQAAGSLVDTLFDVGTAWAEYGLKYGRFALKNTARALTRTAKALEKLEVKIKRDHGVEDDEEAA